MKIFILGGGASGLTAAIKASERGHKVTVLEKNSRVGKKILQSGNGRCNLGNANISKENYIDEGFFEAWNRQCPPEKVADFLGGLGLRLSQDREGRIYPATYQASTVLDCLRLKCGQLGVLIKTDVEVINISKQGGGFCLADQNGIKYNCDRVIVAVGSTASGVKVNNGLIESLQKLGHTFFPFAPILCPLKTDRALGPLKNRRERAAVAIISEGREIARTTGEVQFRENSLSGIAVFEASFFRVKCMREGQKEMILRVDFVPELSKKQLQDEIDRRLERGFNMQNVLTGLVSDRVALFVSKEKNLAAALKGLDFCVKGDLGISEAQACDGGFDTKEVGQNMQSCLVEGLFFTGECLRFAGNCGGFNLHAAWATGIVAGETI